MMEPVLCPGNLEVNMDWDRKARRGAAVADKFNYMGMLLTCPTLATDGQFITNDHWSLAKIIHDVLETIDNATHIFSYSYEPNIHTVTLEFIKILCTIKKTSLANPGAAVKRILYNMKVKWCAYFAEFPLIYSIAAILDPGVKLEGIAKDILVIPASTIASKSAFSAGRRVLDEKRSRPSSKSIEMCVCKKDWDQAEKRTQGLKEEEEDEDDPWMTLDTSDSDGSVDGGNQQQQQAP
ncbi:putative AC transposase [Bienertia sinuspersici]